MPIDLKKNLADLPEVDSDIDEDSEFYRRNVVPVDRGWAWVICFGEPIKLNIHTRARE